MKQGVSARKTTPSALTCVNPAGVAASYHLVVVIP